MVIGCPRARPVAVVRPMETDVASDESAFAGNWICRVPRAGISIAPTSPILSSAGASILSNTRMGSARSLRTTSRIGLRSDASVYRPPGSSMVTDPRIRVSVELTADTHRSRWAPSAVRSDAVSWSGLRNDRSRSSRSGAR